jgi:pilus assembly protein CpaC
MRVALAAIGLLLASASASGIEAAHAAGKAAVGKSVATQRVKLGLNKSVVIDLPSDAYDILVANPAVADAVTRTSRRIYLFGKAVGQTNIFVFGPNGEQIVSLDLDIERDVAGLEDNLRRFIPGSDIHIELVNDNVVLTGTVETPLDAKRAVDLANAFVTGGEATTGQYSQTAAGGSSSSGVDINNPDSTRQKSAIINLLQIIGDDQVTLKVTVAEVNRNVMKQLGVKMIGQADGISFETLKSGGADLLKLGTSGSSVGNLPSYLEGTLNAMEQSGVMKTLAEPTLSAVSGEKATFRVGGEYKFQVMQNNNGTISPAIDSIEYGIGLEFQPVVLSAGRISLKVRTSVSEPTSGGDGQEVTGALLSLRKRLADTTVELPSGGSMMIAGLVNDNIRQSVNAVPGLTKIPVLGALFRSREFVRNESELVVIITPYLVRPVARNDLAKPDDNFNPPSDGAGIFLGRVNRVYGTMQTDRPAGRYHGVVGFIYK